MSTTLLQSLERQRKATEQATLALSLLPLGERQYRAQDLQGAADTYMRALKLDEDNPLIHYRLGYVYVQSGQLSDAERHLQQALSIDPEFHLAMAALGYVYRRIGDKLPEGLERDEMLNKAEAHLIKALRLSPKLVDDDSESWWGSLGGLYRRRGQIDQAIYAYEQAAKVTPHSSYPFSNLAMLYMGRHNREQMLQTFRRVERLARGEVQAEVDNYWAYADLLTSRLALGKIDEAEDALTSVFDLASASSPYALEALVDTLTRLLDSLGGPDAAPHIPPYIHRIQERIGEITELRLKST
ncbi:MAG: tetratricopeptide repeat protein [Chloroflexi bacterium]|nr:tetratricopeptide repeat protein [Chloroflexota bacterium]